MTDKPPRNLTALLESILEIVPEEEEFFRGRLSSIIEGTIYCPPEGMSLWWHRAADFFGKTMTYPKKLEGWQRRLYVLWMEKEP